MEEELSIPLLLGLLASMVFTPLTIYSQAILTWRIFNANIDILRPFCAFALRPFPKAQLETMTGTK